jgi:periplasmic copper chaperone A
VRRIATVLAAAGIALVAAAGPAWAHVKVEPESAPKGSDAVLAFVVPNEKDPQTTTKVVVQFPTDHPIAEALIEPIAGWTAVATEMTVTTPIQTDNGPVTTAVKQVTWTATGKGIAVGDFQEFRVSVGLPDDADSLAFPTIQTYSDGSQVNWIQVSPAGGPEPDDPEPVLTLTTAGSATGSASSAPAATSTVKKSDVDNAKTLALVAVIVGALGLLAGVGGVAMGRRKAT